MGKPGSKACKHLPPKGFSCYLESRIRELFTAAWFPLSEAKSLNAFFEANGLMTHTNSQLLILHLSFYIKHDRVSFLFLTPLSSLQPINSTPQVSWKVTQGLRRSLTQLKKTSASTLRKKKKGEFVVLFNELLWQTLLALTGYSRSFVTWIKVEFSTVNFSCQLQEHRWPSKSAEDRD